MNRLCCGGEAGIRTLDTTFRSYNGLANRRLQPLGHLTASIFLTISALSRPLIRLCSSLCSSSPNLRSSVHLDGGFVDHRRINDSTPARDPIRLLAYLAIGTERARRSARVNPTGIPTTGSSRRALVAALDYGDPSRLLDSLPKRRRNRPERYRCRLRLAERRQPIAGDRFASAHHP